MIKQHLVFLKESLSEFHHTGTVCSTSPWAANKMVCPLDGNREPQNILEVGAGTGAVTLKVLEKMIPGDRAVICEVNPRFIEALKRRLEENEHYQQHKDNIEFFQGLIQDLPEDRCYRTIISSLPFLNFDVDTVNEIIEKYQRLSDSVSTVTYYEYIGLRGLGRTFSPTNRKQRLQQLDGYLQELFSRYQIDKTRVWRNFLPINIYTLQLAA